MNGSLSADGGCSGLGGGGWIGRKGEEGKPIREEEIDIKITNKQESVRQK